MKRLLLFSTLLAVTSCRAVDENREHDAKFAEFKQKLMPQVGKEFTASGHLQTGKFGWWLSFDGWGAYIEPGSTNSPDCFEALNRFNNKEVTVKGVLLHQPEWHSNKRPASTGIPEHFYFNACQCSVRETKTVKTISTDHY